MVMGTESLCEQYGTVELSHEMWSDGGGRGADRGAALHERLVAYVHALGHTQEARAAVWTEHSYARAHSPPPPAAAHTRLLLPHCAADTHHHHHVDVERVSPRPHAPLSPPAPAHPAPSADFDDDDDDEWEARVAALAPGAAHLQLAALAAGTLRALRLARLADAPQPERDAARRLRRALAAALAARGGGPRALSWLHGALLAHAPPAFRRLYEDALAELRRVTPRLAERLAGPRSAERPRSPPGVVGPAVSANAGGASAPWLVWVGGSPRQERRWGRRLGALLHVRVCAVAPPPAAPPDAWCAALAGAARHALNDVLADAGERGVVLCGAGRGACMAAALCEAGGGARVLGAVLLAPPLRSAEGGVALREVRAPLLVVSGERAARRLARAAPPARHVLLVRGADHALRLPAARRRLLRLPRHALDAAVADECARWVLQVAESAAEGDVRDAGRAPRRRAPPPTPPPEADAHDEYAHLATALTRHDRSEAVVCRGSGGTPLALPAPRRAPPAPPALAPADILRLPIVFADDEGVAPPDAALTVTSGECAWRGAAPYTRVIVASRPPPRPPRAAPRPPRPLLLRRAVRLVPRPP